MAYKAVFINESHIAHSNWKHSYGIHGGSTYQYVPTHNGIGNPHHGVGGMFTQNPMGKQEHTNNTVNHKPSTSSDTSYWQSVSGGNDSSTTPPPAPGFKNSDNYRYQNPKNMTDAELKEARDRVILENAYNKNYPSRAEEFAKAANNTKQFINDGGTFVKKLMPDKIYVPLDLSNMSDEQLRAANNRAQLESQYNQYFNPPKQNKSKEWVDVAITGANLLLSASAIAAPIVWDVIKSKKQGG